MTLACLSSSTLGMDSQKRFSNGKCFILMAIFQVNLGQPVLIEAKDDGGGGDNWTTRAISHTKLQSNHHHQQTNIQFI